MPTRRAFLKGLGAATVAGGVLSATASASHMDTVPDHVTLSYDENVLAKYAPHLKMKKSDREKFLGLFGWVARSSEFDTDVCCYWASYTHQNAPWWAPETSHYGDHEPCQIEINPDTGEVERVRASIYHWIKGEATGDAVPMDGTNLRLRVVDHWHQYTAASEDTPVRQFDVKDLTDVFEGWLDNGLEEDLLTGSTTVPWTMRSEADFWAPGSFGLPSTEAWQARAAKRAGFGVVGDLTG